MKIQPVFANIFVLILGMAAVAPATFAARAINNMYEAVVPLVDRSEAARSDAIAEGLSQVLIRYSGYSGVDGLAGVSGAVQNAESYVVEFAVEMLTVPDEDGLSVDRSESLWVRYNASKVDQLVAQQQLPIWSSTRPEVRYLVLQELFGDPAFAQPESFPAIHAALTNVFSERGLPADVLVAPIIPAEELWDMNDVDAFKVFEDADIELLVIARVVGDPMTGQNAELMIVQDESFSLYPGQGINPFQDVELAINQFVDSYSVDYAYLGGSGQSSEIYISVLGLTDFASYRRLMDVIGAFEQVEAVRLEGLMADQMLFRVSYSSSSDRLLAEISEKTDLQADSNRLNALGIRSSPFVLVAENYQPPEVIEQFFVKPAVVLPIDTSQPAVIIERDQVESD